MSKGKPLDLEEKIFELISKNQDKILQLSKSILSLQTEIVNLKRDINKQKRLSVIHTLSNRLHILKTKKKPNMKLKTLKDLEIHNLSRFDKCFEYEQGKQYAKEWVRQEAIKWIKALDDKGDTKEPEEGFGATEQGSRMNVVKWIKHFFNILEDDLKKVKEDE